jgi:hypothetical protein
LLLGLEKFLRVLGEKYNKITALVLLFLGAVLAAQLLL